jgi:hypothetical protein
MRRDRSLGCTILEVLVIATTAAAAQDDSASRVTLLAFRDRQGVVVIQPFPHGKLATDFVSGRMGALMPDGGDTTRLVAIEGSPYFPGMVAWLREQFGFPASDHR